jgi:CRP-like cAMP-binding protein
MTWLHFVFVQSVCVFVELTLAAGTRAATVTATEETEFVTLDRKSYDMTMRAEDISRIHAVTEFLSKCAMFRHWGKGALTRLSLYCSPVEPRRGETLVRAGDKAEFVYMLQEGECSVVGRRTTR